MQNTVSLQASFKDSWSKSRGTELSWMKKKNTSAYYYIKLSKYHESLRQI